MSAKILAIGDPHAKRNNINTIKLLTERIIETAEIHKPDAIVILGDLANDHDVMHLQPFNAIVEMLAALRVKAQVYCIVGNHDMLNNSVFLEDHHFFNAFKKWDRVRIIDTPQWLSIGDKSFLGVPYTPPGRFMEAVGSIYSKATAIFCHQEFKGVPMGAIESVHGDEYPDEAPLAIVGHVHDRVKLRPNILYIGAPYQTSFGDNGKKTISLFEFKDDGNMTEELIDLDMPKKVSMKLTVAEAKEVALEDNTEYRLNITGETEELSKFKTTKKYTELNKLAKVILNPTDKIVVRRNKDGSGFVELLSESIKKESELVQEAFTEVMHGISS